MPKKKRVAGQACRALMIEKSRAHKGSFKMAKSVSMGCGQCALALMAYNDFMVWMSITHLRKEGKGDMKQTICIFFLSRGLTNGWL